MGYPVKQSQTARPLLFKLYLSGTTTAATGKTPTVTISKNGGAFASPAGSVTEVANGWYKVAGNATDAGTLGPLVLYATAAGCDPSDEVYEVVCYDPDGGSEVAGRPTEIFGMIRRNFEWLANKRTRDRSTGTVLLRNAADNGTLETQTQSTGGTTDTITQGV